MGLSSGVHGGAGVEGEVKSRRVKTTRYVYLKTGGVITNYIEEPYLEL